MSNSDSIPQIFFFWQKKFAISRLSSLNFSPKTLSESALRNSYKRQNIEQKYISKSLKFPLKLPFSLKISEKTDFLSICLFFTVLYFSSNHFSHFLLPFSKILIKSSLKVSKQTIKLSI